MSTEPKDPREQSNEEVAASAMPSQPEPQVPAPFPTSGSDVRWMDYQRNVQQRHQRPAGGWLKSPGSFDLFAAVEQALVEVAAVRGQKVMQVDWVRVGNLGDKKVYIIPTDEHDPQKVAVKRTKKRKVKINISRALLAWKLAVAVGMKEEYHFQLVGKEGPLGPALMIDLALPVSRRPIKINRKEKPAAKSKDGEKGKDTSNSDGQK